MKKIITMTESEYNSQRASIKKELKKEIDDYKEQTERSLYKFPFIGFSVCFIVSGWLFSKMLEGYSVFPTLTQFTVILASLIYIFSIVLMYKSIRAHYKLIYGGKEK